MSGLILVVEDDDGIRQMLTTYLQRKGFIVITAIDGEEAYAKCTGHIPDLILLDVMIPLIDGWQLAKRIRNVPKFALTPIIFLTAMQAPKSLQDGFQMGGIDYIHKPFQFEEVSSKIEKALARRKEVDAAVRAQALATDDSRRSALRTHLDQVSLASLLSIMDMEKRSGVLHVTLPDSDVKGEIHLQRGVVHRGVVTGGPELTGAQAVYHLLGCTEGTAEFVPGDVLLPNEVNLPMTHLLMEGMRLIDEANR